MLHILNKIFTPSAPITDAQIFCGRHIQIHKIASMLSEKGQHAVVYGHRGLGKTSLANVLAQVFENYIFYKVNCNRADTYNSLWKKILRKITFINQQRTTGFKYETIDSVQRIVLPDNMEVSIDMLEDILSSFTEPMVFIFDEFDSVSSEILKAQMADTIKLFSDNYPHLKIILMGVAENITQLLGQHPSIERCIKQINLSEMQSPELLEIIENGFKTLHIEASDLIKNQIVMLSSGYPHYVHQLCYFACENAIKRNSSVIEKIDLDESIRKCVEDGDFSLHTQLTAALGKNPDKNQFAKLIMACILCAEQSTVFSMEQIKHHFKHFESYENESTHIHVIVGMLCHSSRGFFLSMIRTPGGKMYKLSQPLMRPFVKIQMHCVT